MMAEIMLEVLVISDQDAELSIYNNCDEEGLPSSTINIRRDHVTDADSTVSSLSMSLNSGLRKSSGDICLVADSHVQLYPDFKKRIMEAYWRYPDYDIITFRLSSTENDLIPHCHYPKPNKPREQQLYLNFYEISFRKTCIEKQVWFDEDFGAGTDFSFGESFTFLQRALRSGLKVFHSEEYIGQHPERYLYAVTDELNKLKSIGAIDYKLHGWNYVINYINVSMKKLEKREASYGTGLEILNKLNVYLLGAKEFKDKELS
ncbi:MAG: glycosyl transferase [Mucilaginibacter sp.]|nr:glycosyl transferase [Mucilaginibacter sp.]